MQPASRIGDIGWIVRTTLALLPAILLMLAALLALRRSARLKGVELIDYLGSSDEEARRRSQAVADRYGYLLQQLQRLGLMPSEAEGPS